MHYDHCPLSDLVQSVVLYNYELSDLPDTLLQDQLCLFCDVTDVGSIYENLTCSISTRLIGLGKSWTGCLQLLEILEIYWNLKTLLQKSS